MYYKITFNNGPNSYKPTSYTHMTFNNLTAMKEYVDKWADNPPLFGYSIQSIVAVDQCPDHDPMLCNQCAEDAYLSSNLCGLCCKPIIGEQGIIHKACADYEAAYSDEALDNLKI